MTTPRVANASIWRSLTAHLAMVALVLVVGACGSPATTPSPTPGPTPSPAPSPSASPPPSASPSAAACLSLSLELASDRLVDARVTSAEGADGVVFTFRAPSPDYQPGENGPRLVVETAHPPFSMAGSGQVFDVSGSRFLELRFLGMQIADETGNPTFGGSRDMEPEFPILRQLTMFDESEGVVGWIAGLDGGGCPTLETRPDGSVVLTVPA
jgi:hypothetical protein